MSHFFTEIFMISDSVPPKKVAHAQCLFVNKFLLSELNDLNVIRPFLTFFGYF